MSDRSGEDSVLVILRFVHLKERRPDVVDELDYLRVERNGLHMYEHLSLAHWPRRLTAFAPGAQSCGSLRSYSVLTISSRDSTEDFLIPS